MIDIEIRPYSEMVAFYTKLGYKVEERVSMGKIVSLPASTIPFDPAELERGQDG